MPGNLSDERWSVLIDRIKRKRCTPFVGAGASAASHVTHISVQLPPESIAEGRRDEVQEYLNR